MVIFFEYSPKKDFFNPELQRVTLYFYVPLPEDTWKV